MIYSENRYVGAIGTGTPVEQWDTTDTSISQSGNQNADKISLAAWSTQAQFDCWRIRKYAAMEPVAEIVKHYIKPATTLPLVEPTALTTTFEYDDYNKLTEITFPDSTTETLSYDDNGQLVRREKSTGETTEYEWNDAGFLTKVILPNGEPVEYFYDGDNRLVGRESSEGYNEFVQSGWDIVEETDETGRRTYFTGLSAVKEESNAGTEYFHYNHRGDTVLKTDKDGNILSDLSYEAYGKPTDSTGIPVNETSLGEFPFLYNAEFGIRYDRKTKLHYMRNRWYSGEQMRFISSDILMDLNRYAYVSGNPISFIDPLGLIKAAYIEYFDPNKVNNRGTKGKWVRIYADVKSGWEEKVINGKTYRYHPSIFAKNSVHPENSPEAIYENIANREQSGLYDFSKYQKNGMNEGDRETQNCRMFSVAAIITGNMSSSDISQFINDNFVEVDPSKEAIESGYIITYEYGGDPFSHAAIVYGGGYGNDIIIFERDAFFHVYVGTAEASNKHWRSSRKIWKPKNKNQRFNYGIKKDNGLWEVGTTTPFDSLKRYCKIGNPTKDKSKDPILKWYYSKRIKGTTEGLRKVAKFL